MKPAAQRAVRSKIQLSVGMLKLNVAMYGAVFKPPSKTTVCLGAEGAPHEPARLKQSRSCPICSGACGEPTTGVLKSAVSGGGNKLIPVDETVEVQALEASAEFRDEMRVLKVRKDVLTATTIHSSNIYWLVAEAASDDAFAGLIGAIGRDDNYTYIVRFAIKKNVKLYELVARNGLLGLVELTSGSELRESPVEPLMVDARNIDFVASVLDSLDEVGNIDEIADNPHQRILTSGAQEAVESGVGYAHRIEQVRGSFEDELATKSLKASLKGAEL